MRNAYCPAAELTQIFSWSIFPVICLVTARQERAEPDEQPMARFALDHITIHCRDLDVSCDFYCDLLGLTDGYRPPFDGPPGAWLYDDRQRPVVHLYAGRDSVITPVCALDHIAFVVDNMEEIKGRIAEHNIESHCAVVPELDAQQIFLADPDGITLEISDKSAADLIRSQTT